IQLSSVDAITLGTPTSASSASGNGNTSITAADLMTNFSNSSNTNTIKLSASSVKEGQAGIKIGTLSCGNLSGTFSLTGWTDQFEIKGNDLYLNQAWMFDHESYSVNTDTLNWGYYWGWNDNALKIKFTSDGDGSVVQNTVGISITNVTETVTVTPQTVFTKVYGATIGAISADWNTFSHAVMGYTNNHTYFELSEEFDKTIPKGTTTGLTKSLYGSSNYSTTFINNYGSDLKLKWINRDGEIQSPSTIWQGTNSGWNLGDKDIFRIEDASGNLISEIFGGGHRYVIGSDGTIHKYVNRGNQLKLKDKYYFDGTSIKDGSGNSTAVADLGDIKINVRGGLTWSDSTNKGDTIITTSTLASSFFNSGNISDGDPIVNPTSLILDAVDESLLTFEWKKDGSTISGQTSSKLDVSSAISSDGTYKITAIAKDDSALVKLDKSSMTQTVEWVIKIDSADATGQTYGTEGNDVISTGSKNDILILGAGNDQVTSGSGNDIITVGSGADVTDAGGNNDTINLYADSIWTAKNEAWNINSSKIIFNKIPIKGKNQFHDVINGNTGSDTLNLTKDCDAFFLHDAFGDFNSSLSVSNDAYGKKNTDRLISIETINGGAGDDVIDLTSPNTSITDAMVLNGEAGDDVIWASSGADDLNGGDGDDVLFGGAGIDNLTGGAGADTFEFENASGNDVIKDYNLSQGDKLKFYLQSGDPNSITLASSNTVTWGSLSLTFEGANFTSLSDLSAEFITVETVA
ncbi:MAG: hypothetical protein VYA61_06430, partial [Pseudomonadota bacterium]|nr:hypothetical protein [Pseudomonadota bacterium]